MFFPKFNNGLLFNYNFIFNQHISNIMTDFLPFIKEIYTFLTFAFYTLLL